MNRVLLTGAGFSRNWGGWLVNELTNQLIRSVNQAPESAVIAAYIDGLAIPGGNYETILQGFQNSHQADPHNENKLRFLQFIENAIRECFRDMDRLYEGKSAGINTDASYNAEVFLAHFDTIFTTNQDGLVERLFSNLFSPLGYSRTDKPNRFGLAIAGAIGTPTVHMTGNRDTLYCVPDEAFNFSTLDARYLPYVKLHGSYDWQTPQVNRLMISGGHKNDQIIKSPLLKSYLDFFSTSASKPNTHIVIIGYGFGDDHINDIIVHAGKGGAKIHILNPLGINVLDGKFVTIESPLRTTIRSSILTELQGTVSVISQRGLFEIFGDLAQAKHLFRTAWE